jgi:hypothetical protein
MQAIRERLGAGMRADANGVLMAPLPAELTNVLRRLHEVESADHHEVKPELRDRD